jgi:hypothetical protein
MSWKDKRECQECGEGYIPQRRWQKFCSPKCQHTNANRRLNAVQKMREFRAREKELRAKDKELLAKERAEKGAS